jgi:hypothetical protein
MLQILLTVTLAYWNILREPFGAPQDEVGEG